MELGSANLTGSEDGFGGGCKYKALVDTILPPRRKRFKGNNRTGREGAAKGELAWEGTADLSQIEAERGDVEVSALWEQGESCGWNMVLGKHSGG